MKVLMEKYSNRRQAGKVLASHLEKFKDSNSIILGLPRGGIPVAFEVAKALRLPMDVFIVRKLGVPGYEELAMGAIASGGIFFINQDLVKSLNISSSDIEHVIEEEMRELKRREKVYRGDRPLPGLKNKTVILIDDGIATGASMKAAMEAIKTQQPASLVIAIPVADPSICKEFADLVDEVICPLQPYRFQAVGLWYEDFTQTSDDEVINLYNLSLQFCKKT
ncbi:phosphoribosyltransferase [Legionella birminghamensis]|uniref:Phosphoribosyltransferase n=1 Tax=Legionella birminghamensis TaxID=28083 RepID=A0A378I6W1_9GAMM|nr:phosphoribosyltransferase [Legionella birminghamensis]KTC68338.1 phosphoribosyltransferase [Legionella birminghamensis]STX30948.1 phosphoribosyltransferase [Legionella birminghamensis]